MDRSKITNSQTVDINELFSKNSVKFRGKDISSKATIELSNKWKAELVTLDNGKQKYLFSRKVKKFFNDANFEIGIDPSKIDSKTRKIDEQFAKRLIKKMHIMDIVAEKGKKYASGKNKTQEAIGDDIRGELNSYQQDYPDNYQDDIQSILHQLKSMRGGSKYIKLITDISGVKYDPNWNGTSTKQQSSSTSNLTSIDQNKQINDSIDLIKSENIDVQMNGQQITLSDKWKQGEVTDPKQNINGVGTTGGLLTLSRPVSKISSSKGRLTVTIKPNEGESSETPIASLIAGHPELASKMKMLDVVAQLGSKSANFKETKQVFDDYIEQNGLPDVVDTLKEMQNKNVDQDSITFFKSCIITCLDNNVSVNRAIKLFEQDTISADDINMLRELGDLGKAGLLSKDIIDTISNSKFVKNTLNLLNQNTLSEDEIKTLRELGNLASVGLLSEDVIATIKNFQNQTVLNNALDMFFINGEDRQKVCDTLINLQKDGLKCNDKKEHDKYQDAPKTQQQAFVPVLQATKQVGMDSLGNTYNSMEGYITSHTYKTTTLSDGRVAYCFWDIKAGDTQSFIPRLYVAQPQQQNGTILNELKHIDTIGQQLYDGMKQDDGSDDQQYQQKCEKALNDMKSYVEFFIGNAPQKLCNGIKMNSLTVMDPNKEQHWDPDRGENVTLIVDSPRQVAVNQSNSQAINPMRGYLDAVFSVLKKQDGDTVVQEWIQNNKKEMLAILSDTAIGNVEQFANDSTEITKLLEVMVKLRKKFQSDYNPQELLNKYNIKLDD